MKNQRGITLIALVITIIVLLILAGITITLLMGENGVLNRASIATIKTEQGLILEQLRVEMYEKRLDIGNKQKEIDYLKDKQIVKTVIGMIAIPFFLSMAKNKNARHGRTVSPNITNGFTIPA